MKSMEWCQVVFQSTPSARRATIKFTDNTPQLHISIHALREEGDASTSANSSEKLIFQSTPSARRATRFFGADTQQ